MRFLVTINEILIFSDNVDSTQSTKAFVNGYTNVLFVNNHDYDELYSEIGSGKLYRSKNNPVYSP